jgi:class 3 adenylate cyclase/tetratricopeptide (TPR) repeat protein
MRINNIALYIIFILITTNLAISQDRDNEEVINKYSSMRDSKAKVDSMLVIAEQLINVDAKLSEKIYDQASNLASRLNYHEGICESHYRKGYLFFDNNQFDKAKNELQYCLSHVDDINIYRKISSLEGLAWIEDIAGNHKGVLTHYNQILKIYLNQDSSDKEISQTYTKIGNSYLKSNKFYYAQDMYWKALDYARNTGDKSLISSCYINMGIIKRYLKDFDIALKYNFEALAINKKIGDNYKISVNFANISQVYIDMDKLSDALEFAYKALEKAKQTNDKQSIATMLGVISQVYVKQKKFTEAFNYSQQSFNINKEINNINGYIWDLLHLSIINLKSRLNIKDIRKNLDTVIKFAKSNDQLPLLSEAYNTLTEYYYFRSMIDSMNYYMELSDDVEEKIFNYNIINELSNLEDRLISEQKMKEESIKQEANQKEQRTIIIVLVLGAIILFIVAIIIWTERRKSERLLLNVLPKTIASRLKSRESLIADRYEAASIVFIDIVQFTLLSRNVTPDAIVELLNNVYTAFDTIAEKHGLEKIKTIGDCYMAVAGAPVPRADHAEAAARFAIEAMEKIKGVTCKDGTSLEFRCGIDCGPIIAGIIGRKKFIYDLWGDAVNTASRMEEYGVTGRIQVTDRFREAISVDGMRSKLHFEERGEIDIKGKGLMTTYFLENKKEGLN